MFRKYFHILYKLIYNLDNLFLVELGKHRRNFEYEMETTVFIINNEIKCIKEI